MTERVDLTLAPALQALWESLAPPQKARVLHCWTCSHVSPGPWALLKSS